MKIRLEKTFCPEFLDILFEEIESKEIDLDKINEHLDLCCECTDALIDVKKKFFQSNLLTTIFSKGIL